MPDSPDGTSLVGSWALHEVDDLAAARSCLQDALCQGMPWDGEPDASERPVLQNIVLAASELMTNALRHAGGSARLDAVFDGSAVTVSVMDHRPDVPPVLSPDRERGEGGFGLQLTMRMADDVGWYRSLSGTKYVWARFAVPTAASAPVGVTEAVAVIEGTATEGSSAPRV